VYVAKLNTTNGNVTWAFSEGGTGTDQRGGLAVDGKSNVYLTGFYTGTADFETSPSIQTLTARGNSGYSDLFVAKYTGAGVLTLGKNRRRYLW